MNSTILNRDFQHPADGWYQIEARGNHPNQAAGVLQVIDDEAAQSIVTRFNADAQAGKLSHGGEMLIDHEHFKDRQDKETRAYGWLQQLQNRPDGIYGRIRWTATGRAAVDGGDYRFFSTEYDPQDLKVLNVTGDGGRVARPDPAGITSPVTRHVRPLRLAGLTLTNMNNNKGQRPITNRSADSFVRENDHRRSDAAERGSVTRNAHEPVESGPVAPHRGAVHNTFADPRGLAANQPQQKTKIMQSIAQILGLAAEAGEDAVLTEVTRLTNRGDISPYDLTTLRNENKTLKEQNEALLGDQISDLLDLHGVKEEKVRNRLAPVLAAYKNREERVAALTDFGFVPGADSRTTDHASRTQTKLNNRDTRPPRDGRSVDEKASRIHNRAIQIQKDIPPTTLATAYRLAQTEIEQAA